MRTLRLLARAVLLSGVTLFFTVLLLVGLPCAHLRGGAARWKTRIMRRWSRAGAAIVGMRIEVEGRPPEGAFLLVSNHLGYMDIMLLASQTPCRFVSKSEVAHWPVIGVLSRLAGTLFLDRSSRKDVVRVGDQIRAALDEGCGVAFFPEGTSSMGKEVEPFRSSLFAPAAAAGLSVHHATVAYTTPPGEVPAHLSVAWWGDMELAPHLSDLLRMPYFNARVVFGEETVQQGDRKLMADRLHGLVTRAFRPLTAGEGLAVANPGLVAKA